MSGRTRSCLARIGGALLALLLLTSPGFGPIGARTPVIHAPKSVVATPALWVVRDADTTIYLFGTIHVLPPGIDWFRGPVRAAFDASDTLMLEVLTDDRADVTQTMLALGIAAPGDPPLSQRLDPATRARYHALLATLAIDPAVLERFRPWNAAIYLSVAPLQKLGYSTETGVEGVLKQAARAQDKPVDAFETVEQRLGYFAALPDAVQLAYLRSTIEQAEQAQTEIGRMTQSWASGRPQALEKDMNDSLGDLPELADALLYRRNARWAEWIDQRMDRPGSVFVAVGAGHMVGSNSVIAHLKDRGHKARRLPNAAPRGRSGN